MKNKRNKKSLEEIIKDLSVEQKEEILNMNSPSRISDQDNFEKECKYINEKFGFSWKKLDKVKTLLEVIQEKK